MCACLNSYMSEDRSVLCKCVWECNKCAFVLYLSIELLSQVGKQVFVSVGSFTVEPHNVVGTLADPVTDQFSYPTQTGLLFPTKMHTRTNISSSITCISPFPVQIKTLPNISAQIWWLSHFIHYCLIIYVYNVYNITYYHFTYPTRNLVEAGVIKGGVQIYTLDVFHPACIQEQHMKLRE